MPRKAAPRIDFVAREPHFLDHLAPTWHALPQKLRGTFFVDKSILERAKSLGIENAERYEKIKEVSGTDLPLTFTAAYWDMKNSRNLGRLTVITEHGAGQSYLGVKSGSYLRSHDRAGVVGILVPGQYQAEISQQTHPAIPTYAVGVPKLDPLHRNKALPKKAKGVIAFSTHWDCKVCPETRSTLRHYRRSLQELNTKFDLLGHSHPRFAGVMEGVYAKHGIEFVPDFSEVIDRAQVYICDNSSTIFEWASLDRPVVLLNAPWYRRDVEHGLLFWEYRDIGVQVDQPRELVPAIKTALSDPEKIADRRREIVRDVYGSCDGHAAEKAAAALQKILTRWS